MTGGGEGGRGGERAILKRLRRESEWDAEYETWKRREGMQRELVEERAYFDLRVVRKPKTAVRALLAVMRSGLVLPLVDCHYNLFHKCI